MPRVKMYQRSIRVDIEEETYNKLKRLSEELKISMADIVRIAIRTHLKRVEEELGYVGSGIKS